MTEPRRIELLAGWSAALLLVLVIAFAPRGAWALPFAAVATLWMPGHALLLALRARMRTFERTALAIATSLLAMPVIGLVTSIVVGFTPMRVALVYLAIDTVLLVIAWTAAAPPEPVRTRPIVPGSKATLAIALAVFGVSGAVFAMPLLTPDAEPLSLALVPAEHSLNALPRTLLANETFTYRIEVQAGSMPESGRILVSLTDMKTGEAVILLNQSAELGPGEWRGRLVEVGPLPVGTHQVRAQWLGPSERSTHAWVSVREATS